MQKVIWTESKLEAAMQDWDATHQKKFYAEQFFKKHDIPLKRSKHELRFDIEQHHINNGVCGSFKSCAGVLATEEKHNDVLKALFFKNVAYLVMKSGIVMSYRIPKNFHAWIQQFDAMKIDSNNLTPKEKKALEEKMKASLPTGAFYLKPNPKPAPPNPANIGTRTGKKAGSGEHVNSRYRAFIN